MLVHNLQCVMGIRQTRFCVHTEPAPVAEGTGEAAAEGDAAPEATPPAEDAAEGEEDEGGPPKPEYSKNVLEYVVVSSGQVSTSARCLTHFMPQAYAPI